MSSPKAALRAASRASRRDADLVAEDEARLQHFLRWLPARPGVLATYLHTDGEPGTRPLVDAVLARGWEVRVPIIGREVDWARFESWAMMRPAWQSIPSPIGPGLGAGSLCDADIIVASCLAVDLRGYRLGVGGGWYDRALLHRSPNATVIAWARERELVDEVPLEPHDVPVHGIASEIGVRMIAHSDAGGPSRRDSVAPQGPVTPDPHDPRRFPTTEAPTIPEVRAQRASKGR